MITTQAYWELRHQILFGDPSSPTATQLLDWATAKIERLAGQTFAAETNLTVTVDGTGNPSIWLKKRPIITINAVSEAGTLLTEGTDFIIEADRARLLRGQYGTGRWIRRRQSVDVDYDAGYSVIPDELQALCADIAHRAFMAAASRASMDPAEFAIKSITLEGSDSVTYQDWTDEGKATTALKATEVATIRRYSAVGPV